MDREALRRHLTARESEIFEYVAKGLSNAEIAATLGVSPNTVKTHVARILQKLDVSNRTEAVGLCGPVAQVEESTAGPPAIAVLPFETGPETSERRYADGFADDLITRLSRQWFPVISRCSSFAAVAGGRKDAGELGQALNARLLLEGSLRERGLRVRIHVRLLDASSGGRVIWADCYDESREEALHRLDEVCSAVLDAASNALVTEVARSTQRLAPPALQPWELAARGMWLLWKGSRTHVEQALGAFGHALERDPQLRPALYGRALCYQRMLTEQWVQADEAMQRLVEAVDGFRRRHPDDPWANLVQGYVDVYQGRRESALQELETALEREPSSVRAFSLRGQLHAMTGETDLAIADLERAIRLSPCGPDLWSYRCAMALAYFASAEYERAVHWGELASELPEAGLIVWGVLATSYAHLGAKPEARAALLEFQRRQPNFSQQGFRPMISCTKPEIASRYLDGLRLAAS